MEYVAAVATKANPEDIEHYGRLGMKWYQHLYGKEDGRAVYARKGLNKMTALEEKAQKIESKQYNKDRVAAKAEKKATKAEKKQHKYERKQAKYERKADHAILPGHDVKYQTKANIYERKANNARLKANKARDTANQLENAARKNQLKSDKARKQARDLANQIRDMVGDLDINTLSKSQLETARKYSLNIVGKEDVNKKVRFLKLAINGEEGRARYIGYNDPEFDSDVKDVNSRGANIEWYKNDWGFDKIRDSGSSSGSEGYTGKGFAWYVKPKKK